MITFAQVERVAGLLRGRVPSLTAIVTVGDLTHASGLRPQSSVPSVWLTADDPTLIQYTSGSTGTPKGVLLSHGNVLANIRAIGQGLDIRPDDVAVSWLPLYHDMGLIGAWLGTLYFGTPVAILSPLAFLARPARWLWALHSHRGTMSPAPNFAFELCVRKVTAEEIDGLDLSCVRMLLNGSEAVMPDTIERFTQRFAPYGFKPEAMCPVYGLAECVVGLAIAPVGRLPRIDVIAREPFQQTGQAVPASSEDAAPLRFVSCGMPLPDHAIQIVDDTGRPVAERVEGPVLFRGPSVTRGYFRNPDATREVLRPGGWMDSGDLGYWAANELFLTGRRKDVIIKAGRNIYPQEVEELVGSLAGVRKGCVAAFGVDDPAIGTGRLVIVAETRETTADRRSQIQAAIIDHMASALGIPPDTVLLGPPGSVLKTSSGKLRRSATREAYLEGRLTQPRRALGVQWARLLVQSVTARFSGFFDRSGSVVYTGYVIGLLVATLPVLWGLLLVTPRGRPADRLVRVWSRIALVLGGCRVQVEGREKLRNLETAVPGRQPRQLSGHPGAHGGFADRVPVRCETAPRVLSSSGRRHPTGRSSHDRESRSLTAHGWRRSGRRDAPPRNLLVHLPRRHVRPHARPLAVSPGRLQGRRRSGTASCADRDPGHPTRLSGWDLPPSSGTRETVDRHADRTRRDGVARNGPAPRSREDGNCDGHGRRPRSPAVRPPALALRSRRFDIDRDVSPLALAKSEDTERAAGDVTEHDRQPNVFGLKTAGGLHERAEPQRDDDLGDQRDV